MTPSAWFVLHVRSNFEQKVSRFVAGRHGPETFLPTYRAKIRRAGRIRVADRPVFPGYVFVLLRDRGERVAALQAPGVVGLVGFSGRAAPVDAETMRSLRILAAGSAEVRPHPMLREGQRVRVLDGPFAGAVGTLSRGQGRKPRLVVTIDLLGRAAAAPVDLGDVEPIA